MADQSVFGNVSGWLVRHKERIGTIALGHTVKEIEEWVIDWGLYGFVSSYFITKFGPIDGGLLTFVVMVPISTLLCISYIKLYDWSKRDWFGFEALKDIREALAGDSWKIRFVRSILRVGDFPAFVVLSIHKDPFVTTVYLRKETRAYGGLSKREWLIFWSSVLLSNGYWTLRWALVVQAALWLIRAFA